MSAWLCENKLLSLVVDVVKSETFKKYYDVENEYSDLDEDEIIQLLSDINTINLQYLYDSFPCEAETNVINNREYIKQDESNAQRHLSVASFIYQSCDCDENKENKLYLLLRQWCDDYYKIYVDEHDDCEWDIDNPLETIGVYTE